MSPIERWLISQLVYRHRRRLFILLRRRLEEIAYAPGWREKP
jgi:hypothetical protein